MHKIIVVSLGFLFLTSCSEAQVSQGQIGNEIAQIEETNQDKAEQVNKVVSADEFKKLMEQDNIQIIDVRTSGEYGGGYISNAINIDYYSADFKAQMDALDKTKPTLIYCAVGGRSGRAAKILKDLGYEVVYDLKGGYNAWPYK